MTPEELANYTEIAVTAIIDSMQPNPSEHSEAIKQAIHYYCKEEFRTIIHAAAKGFDQNIVDVGHRFGVVLIANSEHGPFAPGLSWISSKLLNSTAENRDELRCIAMMALVAILVEAFPTVQTTQLSWSSPAQFTVEEVLSRMHQLAAQVIAQANNEQTNQQDSNIITLASIIHESRLPKYPQEKSSKLSAIRSESEMITAWIRLLQEYGLLACDIGYQPGDERWMATEKLKVYIAKAGTHELVEQLLSIQTNEAHSEED